MRMSVGMRVLLTIFLAVIIGSLIFILISMFGFVSSGPLESVAATALHGGFWYKFLYAAVCVVLIVIAFIIMFFGMHKRPAAVAQVADFNGGSIVITVKAIEELIQREITNTREIKAAHTRVVSHGDYVDVSTNLSVLPNENIPDVTKALQAKLENEIQSQTGVHIRDMKITVADVEDSKSGMTAPRVS
ncbi:MAG: alkaline shock response membrane anchor protein AmaP [Clostridia bacterium]|nr:alkaline shock response membrane anchor protein AmaP [Clostridia bacterium]